MPIPLSVGDRVHLSGGYDFEPPWLQGQSRYLGTVSAFIPGQNQTPAAVIQHDCPISADNITGETLVLELRYVGAEWTEQNFVHVELCDFSSEAKALAASTTG